MKNFTAKRTKLRLAKFHHKINVKFVFRPAWHQSLRSSLLPGSAVEHEGALADHQPVPLGNEGERDLQAAVHFTRLRLENNHQVPEDRLVLKKIIKKNKKMLHKLRRTRDRSSRG